jgi:hypothetical protein
MTIADEVDSQLAQQMTSYVTESSNEVESIDARMNSSRSRQHVA